MNKEKQKIIIIGAAILVIVLVVVLIFVFTSNKKPVGPSVSTSGSASASTPIAPGPSNLSDNTNVNVSSDGTKVNSSSKLAEEKLYKGLKINNIKLTAKNGGTTFSANVVNNTGSTVNGQPVTLFFFDKDGKQISKLEAYIGKVNDGGTSSFEATVTADLSNAYNFTINPKQ